MAFTLSSARMTLGMSRLHRDPLVPGGQDEAVARRPSTWSMLPIMFGFFQMVEAELFEDAFDETAHCGHVIDNGSLHMRIDRHGNSPYCFFYE
jgi:hypothetical protein